MDQGSEAGTSSTAATTAGSVVASAAVVLALTRIHTAVLERVDAVLEAADLWAAVVAGLPMVAISAAVAVSQAVVMPTVVATSMVPTALAVDSPGTSADAKGSLEASYPAMVAGEPVVAIVLSMAVLGEKFSSHDVGSYLGAAGLVVMVVGVIGLAKATARTEVEIVAQIAGTAARRRDAS